MPEPSDQRPYLALRVLSVSNQKGGVGKTTTAINLGTALAAVGERVLILDIDPQGNASTGLGVPRGQRKTTAYDVIVSGAPISGRRACKTALLPASTWLAVRTPTSRASNLELAGGASGARSAWLRDAIQRPARFDRTAASTATS